MSWDKLLSSSLYGSGDGPPPPDLSNLGGAVGAVRRGRGRQKAHMYRFMPRCIARKTDSIHHHHHHRHPEGVVCRSYLSQF